MRERELKRLRIGRGLRRAWSLPMRERELKPADFNLMVVGVWSLPMRERELKRAAGLNPVLSARRSPCGSVN